MKKIALASIWILVMLFSAVPALAQEPDPLPEIISLYLPVVTRPCQTITHLAAGNCPVGMKTCEMNSIASFQLEPQFLAQISSSQVFYRGDKMPISPIPNNPVIPYDYIWFGVPSQIFGSEVQVILFLSNGCRADATTEYTYQQTQ